MIYRTVLSCGGVPGSAGVQAALDIAEEFEHRPWHANVTCIWNGTSLVLEAENDFDADGLALLDEFSDSIAASISSGFGPIKILSVTRL